MTPEAPDLEAIREARERIAPYIHRTPVLTSTTSTTKWARACSSNARTFRRAVRSRCAALSTLLSLPPEEAARGIVTSSSGNQAAAVSLAARARGVSAYIAMPKIAVASKIAAVKRYGGNIIWVDSKDPIPTSEEYDATADAIRERTGASPVHPYDDLRTIAGQATCALELLEDVEDLDVLLAPVGGGGLLSGTCLAAAGVRAGIEIIGCEPEIADDARESLRRGVIVPQTIPAHRPAPNLTLRRL